MVSFIFPFSNPKFSSKAKDTQQTGRRSINKAMRPKEGGASGPRATFDGDLRYTDQGFVQYSESDFDRSWSYLSEMSLIAKFTISSQSQ